MEILRVAAGDGRLTAEELDQRLEAALTARTYAELAVLTTDLPAAGARPGWRGGSRAQGRGPHRLRQRQHQARRPLGGTAAGWRCG